MNTAEAVKSIFSALHTESTADRITAWLKAAEICENIGDTESAECCRRGAVNTFMGQFTHYLEVWDFTCSIQHNA